MNPNKLEQKIIELFPETPIPDGKYLAIMGRWFDEDGGFHEYINQEAEDYLPFFQDKSWCDLIGDPLINWGAAAFSGFSFLNPIACAYYLPAYMLTVMRSYSGNPDLVEGLFYKLIPPKCLSMDEKERKIVLTLIDKCSSLPAELRDRLRKSFGKDIIENVLQKEAVMKSLTQDHDDFLNALSITQKMAIREFIIYMSNIHAVEKLAKKALECYWAEMDV
jgi:hypothetical protein